MSVHTIGKLVIQVSEMTTSDLDLLLSVGKGPPHRNANGVH